MSIKEIIGDSLRYPILDWKKFLLLGFITLIISTSGIVISLGANPVDVWILILIGFVIGFFVNGYLFKIVKSSLDDLADPPKFDNWKVMFIDGVKVFLVAIVYSIPTILITAYFIVLLFEPYFSFSGTELNSLLLNFVCSLIEPIFSNFILILYDSFILVPEGIYAIIGIVYMVIIIPIFLMALGNMANYDGEFVAAFRFSEIFDDIGSIGWINLLKWYVVTGILFLIIVVIIPNLISYIFYSIHFNMLLVDIIWSVAIYMMFFVPYSYMFFARSLALFYISE
jgi:hypothetical protein